MSVIAPGSPTDMVEAVLIRAVAAVSREITVQRFKAALKTGVVVAQTIPDDLLNGGGRP